MTYAKFVEDVRISCGQVRDRVVTQHQPFEHRLVNETADRLLVGSDRVEVCILHAGTNDFFIDLIKIDGPASVVRFLPEGHEYKTEGLHMVLSLRAVCREHEGRKVIRSWTVHTI